MTLEVKSAVKNCKQCLRHDGDSVRAPTGPLIGTVYPNCTYLFRNSLVTLKSIYN